MKNQIKLQVKKSLSLIMAVLMVLSCWVWLAPTEAEANKSDGTAIDSGLYYAKATFNVTNNWSNGSGNFKVILHYKTNNGYGSTGTVEWSASENWCEGEGGQTIEFTDVPGFPYQVEFKIVKIDSTRNYGYDSGSLYVGKDASSVQLVASGASYDGNGANSKYATASSDKYPTIAGFSGITATDDVVNATINKIGGANTSYTVRVTDGFVDQYGVQMSSAACDSHVTGNTPFKNVSKDSVKWYFATSTGLGQEVIDASAAKVEAILSNDVPTNAATVTISPELQAALYYDDYIKKSFWVVCEINGKKAGCKLNLDYPEYLVEWKADASVDSSPTTVVYAANDTTYGASAAKYSSVYYGQNITKLFDNYPTGVATKEGYTFYGFWSNKQPGTKADGTGAYAFEADFVQPMATEDYNALSQEEKDSGKYYPAGVKYDVKMTDTVTCEGDITWYGWWVSNDINVKFYDIDGKFLQENVVKYGYTNSKIEWATPLKEQYVSGSYQYDTFTGKWVDTNGEVVNSSSYTFVRDLILTPKYDTVSFTDKYTVEFKKKAGTFGAIEYTYRQPGAPDIPTDTSDAGIGTLSSGDDYTYEFVGWSEQTPLTGNYHIIQEDGDFDTENRAIHLVSDFTVRKSVIYYPVYRRYLRSYDVTFIYTNEKGEEVTAKQSFQYGKNIAAPEGVPAEYATGGYGYKFLGWTKTVSGVASDVENIEAETCIPGLIYTAKYSAGVPTPYNITFQYRNESGELVEEVIQVNHGDAIGTHNDAFVDGLADKVAETYDDGKDLYTFNGWWKYDEAKPSVKADGIKTYEPENHTTFNAVYANPQPFYTVTYVDGNITEDFRIVTGSTLPYWKVESAEGESPEDYIPTRPDTDAGFYTFKGWYDVEQVEGEESPEDNKYIPGTTVITANTTLYPHFDFSEFEYHYEFRNWNSALLGTFTYNYDDPVDDDRLAIEATLKADADNDGIADGRPADETYTYLFLGWDKKVPSFCEGGEPDSTITFIAQYKPVYIMYKAMWYNSVEDMNASATPLATQTYVYGEKVRTPSVVTTPNIDVPAGQSAVFTGWCYKDADGNEQPYTRQLTLDAEMKFYATYGLTAKKHTVTVVVSATESYTLSVADGEAIKENMIVTPASGYVDANKHNEFTKWTIGAVGADNKFVIGTTEVTDDITIYANFVEGAHEYDNEEVKTLPTYPANGYTDFDGEKVSATDGKGVMVKWCSCNREETAIEENIDALTDTVVPGATIYLGTQWNSNMAEAEGVQAYLNAKSNIIITTSDSGDVNDLYNASGKGSGVEAINVAIFADGPVDPAEAFKSSQMRLYSWQQQIQPALIQYYAGWDNVPDMYKEYNANATTFAENFGLTEGETYNVYVMITDKAGNKSYFKSADFIYDTTAPVGGHTGLSNEAGDKFCEKIVVTAKDDNLASVTANGVELKFDEEANGYVIDEVGTYKLTATDKAGNSINAYFSVVNHNYDSVTTPATCLEAGKIAETCYNCGHEKDIVPIEALGHDIKTTITPATCETDGYVTTYCTRCDYNQVSREDADGKPLYPKTGHSYGVWVTTKAATCQADGLKAKTCSACGAKAYETITSTGTEHNWRPVRVHKATCTLDGERYRTCRICEYKDTIEVIKATGHVASGKYEVTKEPGCERGKTVDNEDGTTTVIAPAYGEKFEICSVCEEPFGDAIAITDLKAHVWELTQTVEPTATAKGHLYYKCKNCTATYDQEIDQLVQYTVNFYDDEGKLIKTETVATGVSVTADAPTKANSADGKTKYEFAGWYTKKADGSYDQEYTLPYNATKNVNLYAKFNAKDIIYTLQFKAATKYDLVAEDFAEVEEFKVLMGSMGDEREPGNTPSIKEDNVNTYVFKGWTRAGEDFDPDAKIIIEGNATYTAVFEVVPKEYDVVFMNGLEGLGKITVTAGDDAAYPADWATPTKASDKDYHYTFKGWDKSLENITAKTTVYAQYNSIAHVYGVGEVTQKADCLLPEMTTYKCACGYEKTEQTDDALGHLLSDAVYDAETGENVRECTRDNCDYEERTKASYTIKFNNENGLAVGILTVEANGEVKFDYEKYGVPTKADDDRYTYTFKGWKLGEVEYAKDAALPNATADVTYVAVYTATARTFRVTYLDSANNVLYTVAGIAYGAAIPEYAGVDTSTLAVPAWNNEQHFVFGGWNIAADATVTSDIVIKPVFTGVDHDIETTTGEASCTKPGGIVHTCTAGCGYEYIDGNVPALGHAYKVIDRKDPTNTTDGYIKYKCDRCGEEYTETLPMKQPITINVTVKDSDGDLVQGATVELYLGNVLVDTGTTNANGVATFTVYEDGSYYVIIKNIPGYDGQVEGEINVGEGSNDVETGKDFDAIEIPDCTCSCHKQNFWGMFFRFFHKIIKLFAGKYVCCACPDPAYD